MARGRASTDTDSDFTDDYPRQGKDEGEPMPEWEMAALYVAQAGVAFKMNVKSTPVRDNIIANLEAAIASLKKVL